MDFSCQICGGIEEVKADENYFLVCKKCAHVKDEFVDLQNRLHVLESDIDQIQDTVLLILDDYKEQISSQDKVEIDSKILKKLWDAAKCQWYESETSESFLQRQVSEGFVFCQAVYLFTRNQKHSHYKTAIDRLRRLHEACENYLNHKYPEEEKVDMTPEEFLTLALQELEKEKQTPENKKN